MINPNFNLRENTLVDALKKNATETEHWNHFKDENKTAIENLKEFSKHLTLSAMVPICKKAFVSGKIIHTNEVLVGHMQGYFSKCSANKAQQICEHRISMAENHLKSLKTEESLFQNKLHLPYMEGAIPSSEHVEIIEEYDEKREIEWKAAHRENVRRSYVSKQKERIEKKNVTIPSEEDLDDLNLDELDEDDIEKLLNSVCLSEPATRENEGESPKDIFNMLDEAMKREEKENELEKIEPDNSDALVKQLIANEKKSKSHNNKTETKTSNETNPKTSMITKSSASVPESQNVECSELKVIKEKASYLDLEERIEFYRNQIAIYKKKIEESRNDYAKSYPLLVIRGDLEDELMNLRQKQILAYGLDDSEYMDDAPEGIIGIEETESEADSCKNRRITFADSEETIEFCSNQTVSDMLSKPKRDVIELEPLLGGKNKPIASEKLDKKQRILEKINQQVASNMSPDTNIVDNIISSWGQPINTLYINFKHSDNESSVPPESTDTDNTLRSPADFYKLYEKSCAQEEQQKTIKPPENEVIYLNSYIGEEHVKAPILKETKRNEAYVSPRVALMNKDLNKPVSEAKEETETNTMKSILRNKNAVAQERRVPSKPGSYNKRSAKSKKLIDMYGEDVEYISAYEKVMNDVLERQEKTPDPLPEGNFVDSHAPKKRISFFKQNRLTDKSKV